ncbi:MAG TPA: ABC transporter permease, partial [Rudaea sp.]|nr:ABC transporter permease [Rudaea sp.]
MMGFTGFLLSLREIQRNLLRSFLTILGIVIGVAAVITMVTLGNGATKAVSDQISSLGSNLLIVRPGQRFGAGHGSAPPFRAADVRAISDQIGSLQAVAPSVQRSATVVRLANNWTTVIGGSTNAYFTARQWQPAIGRIFTETEERAGKAVCVIGETVRRELFGQENPIGGRIRIKQFSCEVIGLLAPKGQAAMGQDQDDTIMMPLRTVQRRLAGNQDVNALMISVADGASIDRAKSQIEK